MKTTDHLVKAKRYIARGEDFYRKAAEEIKAAKVEDGLSNRAIAAELGRNESWVRKLLKALDSAPAAGALEVDWERIGRPRDEQAASKVAREHPEVIAKAIAAAPPEAQRKIADEIIKSPDAEPSLRSVAKRSSGSPPKLPMPKAEQKLGDGVFRLWEAGELLMDETPAGDERVRMAALAEKAQRLAAGILHLLDSGELDAEFRALVEEVGADA